MARVKSFDDKVEENPDFMTLRDHFAKTVSGDGKKVMLMGALWRLLRMACRLSQDIPYEAAKVEPSPTPRATTGTFTTANMNVEEEDSEV